mmetsp:Transcript_43281/g.87521  ORF Transcript_43281/g.87521 Transcript_43281/m.87521 type:complete len:273 (+) Transcript_43281:59-877(+)
MKFALVCCLFESTASAFFFKNLNSVHSVKSTRMAAKIIKSYTDTDFPSSSWPYSQLDLARLDEGADIQFYSAPRFVTHIDDGAIQSLTEYYLHILPAGADVLDICSSWVSHLPKKIQLGRVEGLGMNTLELEENAQLTGFTARDLNSNPTLPYEDASFDIVTCVVSVDYLTSPLEVFQEINRVLRPGGSAHISFSNRCFPSKAVSMWLQTGNTGRAAIIASYFHYSSKSWKTLETLDIKKLPDLGSLLGNLGRAVVSGSFGDPMFIVRATKK